ncbi:MAG TPA: hypothetical protein VIL66_04445 [Bacillota bacterium]
MDKAQFLNELAKTIKVYQEATARREGYQYDADGNRRVLTLEMVRTVVYQCEYYTNSHRLKTDGKYAYKYDEAGNLVAKGNRFDIAGDTVTFTTSGEKVEYWEYKCDVLNRLIWVTKNGTIVAEYGYDPEGYRVVKRAKGETIHYIF